VSKSAIAVFVLLVFLSISPIQAGAMDFGPGLPADWFSTAWSAGGSTTPTNGGLMVDGARAGTTALYSSGRSLQFEATFTGDPWQHIGFGTDYSNGPWAIFSTFHGGALYARTSDGFGQAIDIPLTGNLIGTSHRYRIDWNSANVVFSIDETVVATNNAVIATPLRPLISDLNVGGGILSVASIEMFTTVTALDLSGSSLPAGWFSSPWSSGGGATVAGGTLTIDGAAAGTTSLYPSGLSLEFTATFTGDPWQHIGFGTDYNAAPWVIFSTYTGSALRPHRRWIGTIGRYADTRQLVGHTASVSHRLESDGCRVLDRWGDRCLERRNSRQPSSAGQRL